MQARSPLHEAMNGTNSALHGGMLSYHYGVRVADERTQAAGLTPVA